MFRYNELISALIAFALCYLAVGFSGKVLIQILQKIGFVQFIRTEGPASHQSKKNTPTAGGIAFLVIILIVPLVLVIWNKPSINWFQVCLQIFILLVSGGIGFWDDYLKKVKKQNEGLQPRQKLFAQIILAILFSLALGHTNTNFFGFEIKLNIVLFSVFAFFVLAGSMNAANLTDGLDGLAASVLGWSYWGLGILILLKNPQAYESIVWAFALAGLCFGFLLINGHPAKAFMGDTGSFFLGGGLAGLALLNKLEWYLLILMLIPIWEVLSVIVQVLSCKLSKKFLGRDLRPFKMTPFHHHLELSGMKEQNIVFWMSLSQAAINILLFLFVSGKFTT